MTKIVEFDLELDDKNTATLLQAEHIEYSNAEISSGLVKGIDPDTIYLRFEREEEEPTTIFLRPDEAQAIIYTLAGALWSKDLFTMDEDNDN